MCKMSKDLPSNGLQHNAKIKHAEDAVEIDGISPEFSNAQCETENSKHVSNSPFKEFCAKIIEKKERNTILLDDGRTTIYYSLTVEIAKRPGQTLGLYLREGNGEERTNGVFVSRVAEKSELEKSPQALRGGDEILIVNQVDVTEMCLDDVVLLMSIPKKLLLKTVRKDIKENFGTVIMNNINNVISRSPAKSIMKFKKSGDKKLSSEQLVLSPAEQKRQLSFNKKNSDNGNFGGEKFSLASLNCSPRKRTSVNKNQSTVENKAKWRTSAPVVIEQENFRVQEYYPRGANYQNNQQNAKSFFNTVLTKSNSLPRHRNVVENEERMTKSSIVNSSVTKNWKKSSYENLFSTSAIMNDCKKPTDYQQLFDYCFLKPSLSAVNKRAAFVGSSPELPVTETVNSDYLFPTAPTYGCYSTMIPVVNYVMRQEPVNSMFRSNYETVTNAGACSGSLQYRGRCSSCDPPAPLCCCSACPMNGGHLHRQNVMSQSHQPNWTSVTFEQVPKTCALSAESRQNRKLSVFKPVDYLKRQINNQLGYVSASVTGLLIFHIIEGRGLYANFDGNPDVAEDEEMYCVIQIDGEHRARTEVNSQRSGFNWNEIFELDVWEAKQADFYVYSWHPMHRRVLRRKGRLRLPEALQSGNLHNQEQCFALCLEPGGQLLIRVGYQSVVFAYRRQAIKRRDAYWGVPLSVLIFRESQGNNDSPILLKRMLNEVELRGSDCPGLYSMCVSLEKKLIVKHQLESQPSLANLNIDAVPDPNLITTLIKDFFRELPEPLVPSATYQMLVDAWRVLLPNNKESNAKLIFSVLECLPDDHKRTFILLMDHLKYLSTHCAQNGLNVEKLSKIFGPLLFCTCRPSECRKKRVPINYLDHRLASFVCEVLMDLWPLRNIYKSSHNGSSNNFEDVSTTKECQSLKIGAEAESYC